MEKRNLPSNQPSTSSQRAQSPTEKRRRAEAEEMEKPVPLAKESDLEILFKCFLISKYTAKGGNELVPENHDSFKDWYKSFISKIEDEIKCKPDADRMNVATSTELDAVEKIIDCYLAKNREALLDDFDLSDFDIESENEIDVEDPSPEDDEPVSEIEPEKNSNRSMQRIIYIKPKSNINFTSDDSVVGDLVRTTGDMSEPSVSNKESNSTRPSSSSPYPAAKFNPVIENPVQEDAVCTKGDITSAPGHPSTECDSTCPSSPHPAPKTKPVIENPIEEDDEIIFMDTKGNVSKPPVPIKEFVRTPPPSPYPAPKFKPVFENPVQNDAIGTDITDPPGRPNTEYNSTRPSSPYPAANSNLVLENPVQKDAVCVRDDITEPPGCPNTEYNSTRPSSLHLASKSNPVLENPVEEDDEIIFMDTKGNVSKPPDPIGECAKSLTSSPSPASVLSESFFDYPEEEDDEIIFEDTAPTPVLGNPDEEDDVIFVREIMAAPVELPEPGFARANPREMDEGLDRSSVLLPYYLDEYLDILNSIDNGEIEKETNASRLSKQAFTRANRKYRESSSGSNSSGNNASASIPSTSATSLSASRANNQSSSNTIPMVNPPPLPIIANVECPLPNPNNNEQNSQFISPAFARQLPSTSDRTESRSNHSDSEI